MSDRELEKIQTTLAHHERQIEDLNDVITAQWKEIDRLKRHIRKTEAQLEDYINAADHDKGLSSADIAARNKPPHY